MPKHRLAYSALLPALLIFSSCEASDPVTPDNFSRAIISSRDGSTIRLSPGSYGKIVLKDLNFKNGITIDAQNATFGSIEIYSSQGITINGGSITGSPPGIQGLGTGVYIRGARRIAIRGMTLTRLQYGIHMMKSQDISVKNNQILQLREDGIRVAQSQRVLIEGNRCLGFTPRLPTFDNLGKLLPDYDHADCIQAWSRPDYPPTSDVYVKDNYINGNMQGIFFADGGTAFNMANGGFARIRIENNVVQTGFWNGISMDSTNSGIIVGNRVSGIGALQRKGNSTQPIKPWIRVANSPDAIVCGNTVDGYPAGSESQACSPDTLLKLQPPK